MYIGRFSTLAVPRTGTPSPTVPFEDAPEAALRDPRWGWPHKWLTAAASGAAESGRSHGRADLLYVQPVQARRLNKGENEKPEGKEAL